MSVLNINPKHSRIDACVRTSIIALGTHRGIMRSLSEFKIEEYNNLY